MKFHFVFDESHEAKIAMISTHGYFYIFAAHKIDDNVGGYAQGDLISGGLCTELGFEYDEAMNEVVDTPDTAEEWNDLRSALSDFMSHTDSKLHRWRTAVIQGLKEEYIKEIKEQLK